MTLVVSFNTNSGRASRDGSLLFCLTLYFYSIATPDVYDDGICCQYGPGWYEIYLGLDSSTNMIFSSRTTPNPPETDPNTQYEFDMREHPFRITPSGNIVIPGPSPTPAPAPPPTRAPTFPPTPSPTAAPTPSPTAAPTASPTPSPTVLPTPSPTATVPTPTAAPTVSPTSQPTRQPTPQPTPQPTRQPTPQPTPQPNPGSPGIRPFSDNVIPCANGQTRVRLLFHTDDWSEDSGYQLSDAETGQVLFIEEASTRPFAADETLYTKSGCLPTSSSKFEFTLTDGFGDGICCSRGLGYYQLYLDTNNVESDHPVWASWETGDGPLENKGFLDEYSTRSTTFEVCASNEVSFSLSFQVDDYPEDTSWTVEEIDALGGEVTRIVGSGANYPSSVRNQKFGNEMFSCLGDGFYRLTFRDGFNDGFCCDFQDKTLLNGFWQYWIDGDMFRRQEGPSPFSEDVVEFEVSNNVVSQISS